MLPLGLLSRSLQVTVLRSAILLSESVPISLRELWRRSGVSDSLKSKKKESSTKLSLSFDFFSCGVLFSPCI